MRNPWISFKTLLEAESGFILGDSQEEILVSVSDPIGGFLTPNQINKLYKHRNQEHQKRSQQESDLLHLC